ncbi:MAG: hypothetical protein V3T59_03325 [Desulfobacterales bacterium]
MDAKTDLSQINTEIRLMKDAAVELNRLGQDFPALTRNVVRILASIKMLELNITDIVELTE